MMLKQIQVLSIAFCCAASSSGQDGVPEGLYEALRNYLKERQASVKALMKSNGLDTMIEIAEIDAGVPVEWYRFRMGEEGLDSINVDAPVMSLLEPKGCWEFSLKARGQYLIGVTFCERDGGWRFGGAGGRKTAWAEVREVYPESSGTHPIIVSYGHRKYLHFPQKCEHNLTMLCDSTFRNSRKREWRELKDAPGRTEELREVEQILQVTTDTYGVLVDSRKTLQYLKQPIGPQRREQPSQGGRK